MTEDQFDELTGVLAAARSRRVVGRSLAGIVLSIIAARFGRADVEGRKRRKRKKKKKKKPIPVISPPPLPPPTATVRCDFSNGAVTAKRFAQTFIAPLSGTPTSAEVVLVRNPDEFELTFEIRTVLESGFPSTSVVYASGVLGGIPKTIDGTDPPRRVSATFTTVTALLTAGQPFALAVTGVDLWQIQLHSGGNACPGGKMFFDSDDDGQFLEHSGGDSDMVFALTISG